jgi:survival motor neuron protein
MDTHNEDSASLTSNVVLFSRNNNTGSGGGGGASGQDDVWDDRSLIRAYDRTVNKIKKQLSERLGAKSSGETKTAQARKAKEESTTATENEEDDEDDYESEEEEEEDTETNASDENNEESPPKVFDTSEFKKTQSNKAFNVGDLCMTIFSDDGLVYPAKVARIFFDEAKKKQKCIVKYLYYLNEEEKFMDELFDYQSSDEEAKASTGTGQQKEKRQQQSKPSACEFHTEFNIPPPPLPLSIKSMLSGKKSDLVSSEEALHSMLMSWYMSGYHTGFYLGLNQATTANNKKNSQSK